MSLKKLFALAKVRQAFQPVIFSGHRRKADATNPSYGEFSFRSPIRCTAKHVLS
jgi:hypothetical protein